MHLGMVAIEVAAAALLIEAPIAHSLRKDASDHDFILVINE